jgi:hypothetical protein
VEERKTELAYRLIGFWVAKMGFGYLAEQMRQGNCISTGIEKYSIKKPEKILGGLPS